MISFQICSKWPQNMNQYYRNDLTVFASISRSRIYFTFLGTVITDIAAQCLMYCTGVYSSLLHPSPSRDWNPELLQITTFALTQWQSDALTTGLYLIHLFCLSAFSIFSFPRVGVKWGCQAATAASSSWFSSSTSCSGSSDSVSSLWGKIRKWGSGSASFLSVMDPGSDISRSESDCK